MLTGEFDRPEGVREGRAILYRPGGGSIDGELNTLAGLAGTIVVHPDDAARLGPGSKWPYYSGYWEPEFVDAILDPSTAWTRVRLVPRDALKYTRPAALEEEEVVLEAGEAVPSGAKIVGQIRNAFDRVTCGICDKRIGPAFEPFGYRPASNVGARNSLGIWLCQDDFRKFAERRSAAFLL